MLTPYYKNFLETILHFAVPLTTKLTGPFVTSSDINSGTKKRDFLRAYLCLRVLSIVTSH